jgi:hypothetical protein
MQDTTTLYSLSVGAEGQSDQWNLAMAGWPLLGCCVVSIRAFSAFSVVSEVINLPGLDHPVTSGRDDAKLDGYATLRPLMHR